MNAKHKPQQITLNLKDVNLFYGGRGTAAIHAKADTNEESIILAALNSLTGQRQHVGGTRRPNRIA